MTKTILLTGATAGIGLETAKRLSTHGHKLLLHGRSEPKLDDAAQLILSNHPGAQLEPYLADLSSLSDVDALADAVAASHDHLDVIINNAGILKTPNPITDDGFDIRFVVNTLAPCRLTTQLLPLMDATGRVVNLSSAAQAPVDIAALAGPGPMAEMDAYSQSKLAITMWTRRMADQLGADGPMIVAVNPGSLLATKMVKEGFGVAGNDIGIGADILERAALSDEFSDASGQYFDNDSGQFAQPHADGLDNTKIDAVMAGIDAAIEAIMTQR